MTFLSCSQRKCCLIGLAFGFLCGFGLLSSLAGQVQVTTYAVLDAPDGLARDAAGNLFAANYGISGPANVYKIDRNQMVTTFLQNQSGPAGMVFDDEGNLYLSRYDAGQVVRVSPDGAVITPVATGIAGPIGLDFDTTGNLYVNHNVAFAITRVDTNDQQNTYATHNVFNTSSLTFDHNQNLYVSRYQTGRVIKITPDSQNISDFVNLPINGIGFILYSHGYLYATAILNHFIYRISLDGVADTLAGTGVQGYMDGPGSMAQFNRPNGLTASPDGDTLFVAEHGGYIRMITGVKSSTGIDPTNSGLSQEFAVKQNYPNPFNPITTIEFELSTSASRVTLQIYDIIGRQIETLYKTSLTPGNHKFVWNATDAGGNPVASGVYFYRLETESGAKIGKMQLIR